jgi:hypothetical protein
VMQLHPCNSRRADANEAIAPVRHALACRWLLTRSANGNRIDDRLDPTCHPGLIEHEQKLPCFVADELLRVHVQRNFAEQSDHIWLRT